MTKPRLLAGETARPESLGSISRILFGTYHYADHTNALRRSKIVVWSMFQITYLHDVTYAKHHGPDSSYAAQTSGQCAKHTVTT